ncbi:MAG: hypothetical protein M1498_05290 [Candidatus Thermoplasmatota archaeon]|nr:hypothetical protein [Candidatus Thermoplasmatota archaeon]
MSVLYHVNCPNCGNEFNVNYSELNSFSDPPLGIIFRWGPFSFSVKCPECHKRERFHVTPDDAVKDQENNE